MDYNSSFEGDEIEQILQAQALLVEYRNKYPSDTLLGMKDLWFEEGYREIYGAQIMDVSDIIPTFNGSGRYRSVRIRFSTFGTSAHSYMARLHVSGQADSFPLTGSVAVGATAAMFFDLILPLLDDEFVELRHKYIVSAINPEE